MQLSFDPKIGPICRMLKKLMEWQRTDNYVIRTIPPCRLTIYFLRFNSILFRGNNDEAACGRSGSEKLLVSLPGKIDASFARFQLRIPELCQYGCDDTANLNRRTLYVDCNERKKWYRSSEKIFRSEENK